MFRQFRFGFDWIALVLFFILMAPNFFWFAVPASHDILRQASAVPVLGVIATIAQVTAIVALCLIRHQQVERFHFIPLIWVSLALCSAYYGCWGLYYASFVHWSVLLALAVFPCAALFCYGVARKNYLALFPITVFSVCHIGETVMGFF